MSDMTPCLPDRCPAVDDTTGRRCNRPENHDGAHTDGLGYQLETLAEPFDPLVGEPCWMTTSHQRHCDGLSNRHPFLSCVGSAFLVGPVDQRDDRHYYTAFMLSGNQPVESSRPVTADEFYRMVHQHITR